MQTAIARRRAIVRRLRADGKTVRQIAAELHVGRSTVARDLGALNGEVGSPVPNAAGPANRRAVTHGALSQALVRPRAVELEPQILGAHKHLDAGRDSLVVKRYCVVLARIELVYDWLDGQEHAVFTDADTGTVHAVYTRLQTWERQASELEAQLASLAADEGEARARPGPRALARDGHEGRRPRTEGGRRWLTASANRTGACP